MKTIILIGAKGKMGQAALSGLGKHKVITAGRLVADLVTAEHWEN